MTASEQRRLIGIAKREGITVSELLMRPWREEWKNEGNRD
jgi:hypothetical protein